MQLALCVSSHPACLRRCWAPRAARLTACARCCCWLAAPAPRMLLRRSRRPTCARDHNKECNSSTDPMGNGHSGHTWPMMRTACQSMQACAWWCWCIPRYTADAPCQAGCTCAWASTWLGAVVTPSPPAAGLAGIHQAPPLKDDGQPLTPRHLHIGTHSAHSTYAGAYNLDGALDGAASHPSHVALLPAVLAPPPTRCRADVGTEAAT